MTNNIADTLKECHRIVWQYRAELEQYWPTPNTEDALLFAFTELGEAVDAHLRSKAEYARNRDKDLSVLDELADCAMMLLTALGSRAPWSVSDAVTTDFWAMADWLVRATDSPVHRDPRRIYFSKHYHVCMVLTAITTYPGMDLPARLRSRLERIKAKRMPRTPDAYDQILLRHAGSCQ